MATTFTASHRREITVQVNRTFLRAIGGFPAPFESCALAQRYWYAQYPAEMVEAFLTLKRGGAPVGHMSTPVMPLKVMDDVIMIHLHNLPGCGGADDYGSVGVLQGARVPSGAPVEFGRLQATGTDPKQFAAWVKAARDLDLSMARATVTLFDLLDMANSPGQLLRMVPELLPYIYKGAAPVTQRASRVPDEWTGYDRGRVMDLTYTLAKCHLLVRDGIPAEGTLVDALSFHNWARSAVAGTTLSDARERAKARRWVL